MLSAIIWWGMLIALMAIWTAQGHPVYKWMEPTETKILYISDIAASSWHVQPIFIACSGAQGILFVLSLVSERWLRHRRRLRPNCEEADRALSITAIVCAFVGELGILIVSIFNTHKFHHVHEGFLVIFIVFLGLSAIFTASEFGILDNRTRHQRHIVFSFYVKIIWFIIELALAIAFGATSDRVAPVLEWTLAFIYPFYMLLLAYDLWPAYNKKPGHYSDYNDYGKYPVEPEQEMTSASP